MKALRFLIWGILIFNISIGEEIKAESSFQPNSSTFPIAGWYFGYNASGDSAYVRVNDTLVVDSLKGVVGFSACATFRYPAAIEANLIIVDSCLEVQVLDSCENPSSCNGYYPCLLWRAVFKQRVPWPWF